MTPQDYDALMSSDDLPPEDLDLIAALGRMGRERRPGRELAQALDLDEERLGLSVAPEEELLAAESRARAFPQRYEGEQVTIELRLGLGGLPAAVLLQGEGELELLLDGEAAPLALGRETLLVSLGEPPDLLQVRSGLRTLLLRPATA